MIITTKFQFVELNKRWMPVWFWCKFGATLYRAILTIFTISNGIAKTRRDNWFTNILHNTNFAVGVVFLPLRVILSLSNFSVEDPVCSSFDAASQFDFASLRSGWHDGKARATGEWNLGADLSGYSICKNSAVLFTFCRFYGIILLIDKLEFDEDHCEIEFWRI